MPADKPSLSDLRIEDHARDGGRGRVGLWIVLLALAVSGAGLAWYWFRAPRPAPFAWPP